MIQNLINRLRTINGISVLLMALVVLSAGGLLFVADNTDKKWAIALTLAFSGGMLIWAIPEKRLLWIGGFFFLIAININFHPIYIASTLFRPVGGLVVAVRDLPFLMLLVMWFMDYKANPDAKKNINPVPILYILALIWITLSMFHSDMSRSIALFQIIEMLKCLLVVIILPHFIKNNKVILLIVVILMLNLGIQAIVGGLQYLSGSNLGLGVFGETKQGLRVMRAGAGFVSRVGGTIGSNNMLAAFIGAIVPIGVGTLFSKIDLRIRLGIVLPLIAAGLGLDAITFSRGGWLALFFGTLITTCWALHKRTGRIVLPFIGVFLTLMVVAGMVIALSAPVRSRIFESDFGGSKTRVYQDQVALRMIADNPVFGVGLGTFPAHAQRYDNTVVGITYGFPMPVHNEYLCILAETGLPPLILLFIILLFLEFSLFQVARNSTDPILPFVAIGVFSSFIAWMIQNLVEFSYVYMSFSFWCWVGLALGLKAVYQKERIALR